MSRNQIENQFSLYMLGLNLLSLPEYSIDSMPLKGGGGEVKGEEEGKKRRERRAVFKGTDTK